MKTMARRFVGLILVLLVTVALIPANAQSISAATLVYPSPDSTWMFTDSDADVDDTYGDGSWSWVRSTKTLTLTNIYYISKSCYALFLPPDSTIVLNGTNVITSYDDNTDFRFGIYVHGLTITSDNNGELFIRCGTTTGNGSSYGIFSGAMAGILEISGNANVTVIGGTTTGLGSSYGIYAAADFKISDNAIVSAIGGTSATGDSVGIFARPDIRINDSAIVSATGGLAVAGNSYGIAFNTSRSIVLNSGMVMAAGATCAINRGYIIPSGYAYTVSNNTDGAGHVEGTSNGTFVIDSTYNYAQIVYLSTNTPDPSLETKKAATPTAPTLISKTSSSVKLTPNSEYEFSKDGSTWQTSSVFNGLQANRQYYFYQRVAETADTFASAPSPRLVVSTDAIPHTVTVINGIAEGVFRVNTLVYITADNAPAGQVFDKWVSSDINRFADAAAISTTFNMPDKAVTVEAIYKELLPDTYTINEQGDDIGNTALVDVDSIISDVVMKTDDKFTTPSEGVAAKVIFEPMPSERSGRKGDYTALWVIFGCIVIDGTAGCGVYLYKKKDKA